MASTTATLEVASALLKFRPEVIVPELSGPSELVEESTPVTENELVLRFDRPAVAPEPPGPPVDAPALIVPDRESRPPAGQVAAGHRGEVAELLISPGEQVAVQQGSAQRAHDH